MPKKSTANLPPWLILDPLLHQWLQEDIGRGDRTTQSLFAGKKVSNGQAQLRLKTNGTIAGLPLVERVFQLLEPEHFTIEHHCSDGSMAEAGITIAQMNAPLDILLMGERVALNILMRLSGIATLTSQYYRAIADLPTRLVDTRKTTPGMRLLEKYAVTVGGAQNHRFGLDDAVMIKDNHIQAAGGIPQAIAQVRQSMPYPLAIEVEAETPDQAWLAAEWGADILMLDNMAVAEMAPLARALRAQYPHLKLEASGNITLDTIRPVAQTGVDYISTSATITQAPWLDISMKILV